MSTTSIPERILFFDGVCTICNRSVDFILKHNPEKNIYFSSLQSDFAYSFLKEFNLDPRKLENIVFVECGTAYVKSEALLKLNQYLIGTTSFSISILRVFPKRIRDYFYDKVAKNRYRIGSKKNQCRIPTKEELDRFLE